MPGDVPLTRMERAALRFAEFMNENPRGKWLQGRFLRGVSYAWVRAFLAERMFADGLDELATLRPERGAMLVSNHRSFFDQYAILLSFYMGRVGWARDVFFPVRANFFYDQPLGVVVNALAAGGAMYPPVFRSAERRALNDDSLDRMVSILRRPNAVVGMHPEGTRNKGDDPYKFLPAQPGVGKLALVAQPLVIPAFVLGLGNRILEDIGRNFQPSARREHAVICVYGKPVDYSDLMAEKPRPALYKKTADRFMIEVGRLAEREKQLRVDLLAGKIRDDDPRWLNNLPIGKLYAPERRA